jgi:hypothetical protein
MIDYFWERVFKRIGEYWVNTKSRISPHLLEVKIPEK